MKVDNFEYFIGQKKLTITIFASKRQMEKERKIAGDQNPSTRAAFVYDANDDNHIGQIITSRKIVLDHPELLMHEAVHAGCRLLRQSEGYAGAQDFISLKGQEEALAVFIQPISRCIIKSILEYARSQKKMARKGSFFQNLFK